jgi:ATP-dependent DNA ligase
MNPYIPPDAMTCRDDVKAFLGFAGGPQNICWSYKLDGVRTLSVVHKDGEVAHFSRNKKRFPNFACFDEGLRALAGTIYLNGLSGYPVVFDSETTSTSAEFSDVMSQLRRLKDVDDSIFRLNVLDVQMFNTPLARRQDLLELIFNGHVDHGNIWRHEHHDLCPAMYEDGAILEWLDATIKEGWEGLVLKTKNGLYEHKKSAQWLKLKGEETADVPVIGWEPGEGKYAGMIGALVVDFKGVKVSVSGMSDAQRHEFMDDLPKMVEIRYQQVTKAGSLRHPRFYRVREDK